MPSFLNDHNSPIHFQHAGVVHLNGPSHYEEGIPNIDLKVNGHVPHSVNSHVSNDSFDGSSSHSTHTSESSDATHMNGNDTRTSTMSTTNGHNGAIEGEDHDWKTNGFAHGGAPQKPLSNGAPITISPPDRAAPPRPQMPNGTADRTSAHSFAEPPSIRTSMASSVQPSPSGMAMQQGYRGDAPGTGGSSNGLNTDGGSRVRSPSPANQRSSLDPNAPPPQRFSSPAQMSGNTSLNSSTPNLHPGPPGLKHRHTLEVPRPGQPRGSRDGQDSAVTSGRFSPTNAGPSATRRASINLVRRNTRSLHSDFPRDEAFPDEDAMRWAEAYRQKRASKKKKKEEEDDDRVLVGTKVDEKHANWVTAYNMLTGIRVAVSRTNAKLDRPLTDADFDAKSKTTFDM